ncbi:MAG: hypothetical protein ACRDTG_25980 [Pseudonocardiaceae bacterium]
MTVDLSAWPHRGAEAAASEPYLGRWIAQGGLEVLYDAGSPYDVVGWLCKNGLRAGMTDARHTRRNQLDVVPPVIFPFVTGGVSSADSATSP